MKPDNALKNYPTRRAFLPLLLILWCTLWGWPARAAGGDMLEVRLIEARQEKGPKDARLADIQHMLENNLPFACFEMIERAALSSMDGITHLAGGFTIRARGGTDHCSITLEQNGKILLETQVRFQKGKPVILGGFPSPKGKYLFVIQSR